MRYNRRKVDSFREKRYSLWLAVTICLIGYLTLGFHVLRSAHDDAETRAGEAARNLIEVMKRDIKNTVGSIDLSLKGVIEGLNSNEVQKLSPQGQNFYLFDRSLFNEYMEAMLVFDENGKVEYDSRSLNARSLFALDRDYFTVHRDNPDVGLYISAPFKSRLGDYWVMTFSRRINKPDGSFAGVASGALRLDYFNALLSNLILGPNSVISILRNDGSFVMRRPFSMTVIGKQMGMLDPDRKPNPSVITRMDAFSPIDGIGRTYFISDIPNLPLVLHVGIGWADVYGHWQQQALTIAIMMAALLLAVGVLVYFLARELQSRRIAEAQVREAAAKLHMLAQTDGLTGLQNRRAFDEALERAWSEAMRRGHPLACLMIDVDFFKAFNDRLGHLAGDQALKTVAVTIAAEVRQTVDVAARYGGEEFAVLVPEIELASTISLAERIRERIAALNIHNPGSHFNRLTVSIGLAVSDYSQKSPVDLLSAADVALYEAKHAGRNCTKAVDTVAQLRRLA